MFYLTFLLFFFLLFLFYFALESVSSVDAQVPKSKSSQKRRDRAIAASQGECAINSEPSGSISGNSDSCKLIITNKT